jgi:very-short-patch-repair endonuclease
VHENIPVTTVPRTLCDIAARLDVDALERAFDRADLLNRTDPLSVLDLMQRHPGRPGARALRAVLARRQGPVLTRSDLEDRFLTFLRRSGLPRPRVNQQVQTRLGRLEVDFLWQRAGVAAELDGYAVHGARGAFETDRRRDRALAAAGWQVVRITWRQLHDEPEILAADLRALLG